MLAQLQALRRAPDIEEMTKSSDGPDGGEDVAAETMADTDSKFVDVMDGSIRVSGVQWSSTCL